jgi:serine/threonine protein kinase
MGTAYLAERVSPEGSSTVVVKVVNPELDEGGVPPELVAIKEAGALQRLNDCVPPSPFVVRLVDVGLAPIFGVKATPWTAIEYVYGGIEGTTLEDRVTYSIHKTGYAFDRIRAAHALRCLSAGLAAIHEVGVIHRDVTPGNVLCCGFGSSEIFKLADFGIARTLDHAATFVGLEVGTLGYAAPEAVTALAGPRSDVFSLACLFYYVLTGEQYFVVGTPAQAALACASAERRSLSEHTTVASEIVDDAEALERVDQALAAATHRTIGERPELRVFTETVLHALDADNLAPRSSRSLLSTLRDWRRGERPRQYAFSVKHRPLAALELLSAAWDSDGRALAVTRGGIAFWNGDSWIDGKSLLEKLPFSPTFTERSAAGGWLVGGGGPSLSLVNPGGMTDSARAPDPALSLVLANGRLDELAVAVGVKPGAPPALYGVAARRFLKPVLLPEVARVSALERLDEDRWLVGGETTAGRGFAAIFSPLTWALEPLAVGAAAGLLAGAVEPECGNALLVGQDGSVVELQAGVARFSRVAGAPRLSVAELDVLGRRWCAGTGVLYGRESNDGDAWQLAWQDPLLTAPFLSALADSGRVSLMAADGTIVLGQLE